MYHLCTTAAFQTIYQKRKILDIRLNIKDFPSVGVTRFELATTRPFGRRADCQPSADVRPYNAAKLTPLTRPIMRPHMSGSIAL